MSAFFIATVSVKNPEKLKEYVEKATITFNEFDGEVITKGKFSGSIVGDADHQMVAIVKFSDLQTLENWYESSSYQALIPLRNEAAEMAISKYTVPQS